MHNSELIQVMHSYEAAVNHFNNVVPLKRGLLKGEKPLGAMRRYTRALIRMDDDVVVCSYYNSDVVKYFPSGEIHLDLCGHNTNSTREFIDNTAGMYASVIRGKAYLRLLINGKEEMFLFPEKGALVVKDRRVMNPQPQTVYRVNRKAMNEVRKRYADFIEYCKTMGAVMNEVSQADVAFAGSIIQDPMTTDSKLRQLVFVDNYWGRARGHGRTDLSYMQDMLEQILRAQTEQDYEHMSARFTQLAVSNMHFNWRGNYWTPRLLGEPVAGYALGAFDEVLKYVHREEVFQATELAIGEVSGTTNEKYFLL